MRRTKDARHSSGGSSFNPGGADTLPKISIVTPSLNQVRFIERTMNSVLNQNYPNLEYIVIDGGSTDGTVELLENNSRRLSYWHSRKDRGQSEAIHQGFEMASGDILGYLNSDDMYCPGALLRVGRLFHKCSDVDVVFGDVLVVDSEDRITRDLKFVPFKFSCSLFEGGSMVQPATFWRRSAYEDVGKIDTSRFFCMDYDLFMRFGASRKRFTYIPLYLACFRWHEQSKSVQSAKIGLREHMSIVRRYTTLAMDSFFFRFKGYVCRVRRFFLYLFRGDVYYVFRGVKNWILRRK